MDKSLGKTIKNLGKTFDTYLMGSIYTSLPDSEKNNFKLLSKKFCHSRGVYSIIACLCNVGTYGIHCQKLGIEFWGKTVWILFRIFFSFFFLIFMILSILTLIVTLLNYSSFISIIFSLFTTPKNLVNINIIILSTSKFIYMVYDPYCQYNKVSYKYDRILYELSISSFISIYLLLFIVFLGINANLTKGKGLFGKRSFFIIYYCLKVIVIIILIAIYPTQIILSRYFANHNFIESQILSLIYSIGGIISVVIYIITFCIICKTRKKLFLLYHIQDYKENQKSYTLKIIHNNDESRSFNSGSVIQMDKSEYNKYFTKKKKNFILDFLEKIMINKQIEIVDYSIGRNLEENIKQNIENEDLMYFEEEMKILNQYSNDIYFNNYKENDTNSITNLTENKNISKRNSIFSAPQLEESYEDYVLNENDMIIVHNIFIYSFLFMLVTILYFIYFSFSKNGSIVSNQWSLLLAYFCLHIIELMYLLSIYAVFFKYSTNQQYKNLKFIGEIDKYLNKKFNDISKVFVVYKAFSKSIVSKRFKGFINFFLE